MTNGKHTNTTATKQHKLVTVNNWILMVFYMDGPGWIGAFIQPVDLIPRSSCNITHVTPVENLSGEGH